MTIREYIDVSDYTYINGIQFLLSFVNEDENLDVDVPTYAEVGELDSSASFTFMERLAMAEAELTEDTRGMDADEAFNYFADLTEGDNANYWGHMVYVYTNEPLDATDGTILFGVRMD